MALPRAIAAIAEKAIFRSFDVFRIEDSCRDFPCTWSGLEQRTEWSHREAGHRTVETESISEAAARFRIVGRNYRGLRLILHSPDIGLQKRRPSLCLGDTGAHSERT